MFSVFGMSVISYGVLPSSSPGGRLQRRQPVRWRPGPVCQNNRRAPDTVQRHSGRTIRPFSQPVFVKQLRFRQERREPGKEPVLVDDFTSRAARCQTAVEPRRETEIRNCFKSVSSSGELHWIRRGRTFILPLAPCHFSYCLTPGEPLSFCSSQDGGQE